ncbi:ArsR family transcriptional regulator [Candidatus Woesearchaeota archaeon]|nr:ArsR family transcriptional regulator [Candidatus Woesearchaeota archaeon]
MTLYDDVSFVIRAKNRNNVFQALTIPKTPTQLSKQLDINIGYVSNIIIELLKRELIECLSPNEKRHRLYKISKKGANVINEIKTLDN